MKKLSMPRNLKELIMVLLTGTGLILALKGLFNTQQVGFNIFSQPDWKVFALGMGFILIAVLMGLIIKGGKNI
jgi:succinate dehydrogenase hydrophobic anchor subunit